MSAVTAKNIGAINIEGTAPGFLSKLKSFSLDSVNLSVSPWILFGLFAILVIAGGIYISNLKTKIADPKNVKTALDSQRLFLQDVMSFYAKPRSDVFTITQRTPKELGDQVLESENSLINYCPLTVQDTGYLGPVVDGTFAERDAVQMALRAGARCFVLNIDFHTEQSLPTELFGLPNEPCLLYRDLAGTIRSLNAGQIRNVAQALADFSFSNAISNKNDPLYVVLYFRRTPPKGTLEYLQFLSKVAEQLEPLIPYHLGQTSEGDFHRQAKQSELFYLPVSRFEKKVLIFCNADTSAFRLKPANTYPPNKDLDYLTHVRIYKESTETFGVTDTVEANVPAKATVDTVAMYTIVPPDKKKTVTDATKLRWSIALSDPGKNPSAAAFAYLQDELGVQCLPLWFYAAIKPSPSVLQDMRSKAAGAVDASGNMPTAPDVSGNVNVNVNVKKPEMPAPSSETPKEDEFAKIMIRYAACGIRPKAKAVRFVRPATFTPKAPSTRMDGNQGNLTTPTI